MKHNGPASFPKSEEDIGGALISTLGHTRDPRAHIELRLNCILLREAIVALGHQRKRRQVTSHERPLQKAK